MPEPRLQTRFYRRRLIILLLPTDSICSYSLMFLWLLSVQHLAHKDYQSKHTQSDRSGRLWSLFSAGPLLLFLGLLDRKLRNVYGRIRPIPIACGWLKLRNVIHVKVLGAMQLPVSSSDAAGIRDSLNGSDRVDVDCKAACRGSSNYWQKQCRSATSWMCADTEIVSSDAWARSCAHVLLPWKKVTTNLANCYFPSCSLKFWSRTPENSCDRPAEARRTVAQQHFKNNHKVCLCRSKT